MNRTNVMTLVMLATFGTSVFAVGFLGSPTAEIGQGKWSIGYDYSYSSQKTDKVTAKFDVIGVETGTFPFKLKDFNLQRHYGVIGYGVTEDWDIYVKLGIADLKARGVDYDLPQVWSMNFDNEFAWGLGTRYTFFRQDNVTWGAALQMNWIDTQIGERFGTEKSQFTVDAFDLLASVGPTVDMGSWKVYGGPFYYYLNGDYDLKVKDAGALVYKEKADVKAARNWGAFIGSIINLGNNIDWTVEYATTGKGWGLGTGVAWKF